MHKPPYTLPAPWRIPLFVLLLLLPLAAAELYVRSLPNPSKHKHAYLSRHSREVEILVLGSSHTYYGLCPEVLGAHAFSAAQVSQTLKYDNYLLHHYPFDRLHTVIVPISDFSLYEELENSSEWYLANRYRLYMDCDLHSPLSVYNWECTAFKPFCEKLKSLWEKPRMQWSDYGQGLEYRTERRPAHWDNGAEAARRNRYTDFGAAAEGVAHLEHMAQLCQARGIRLLLLSTPLRPSYREAIDSLQEADTRKRLLSFFNNHPTVRYLDWRADSTFMADDFYDADHLSLQGARKLSAKLKAYLQHDSPRAM